MRRLFIRTFTVRRSVQYTVIQDRDASVFSVVRWSADDFAVREVWRLAYDNRDPAGSTMAHALAVAEALRRSKEEPPDPT